MSKEIIRNFYGKIIGSIETDSQGNKIVRDFYGIVKGRYNKQQDVTRDFRGVRIAKGDHCSALLDFDRP